MELSGAQIIIEELCAHGVDTVFGYPGGTVLPLYDELYKNSSRIKHIITAHEQGAAHAADGYARAKKGVGVVIATSGPGATNLITGIANAYLDSVPMIAITGNVCADLLGKDSFQEIYTGGITQPITKHNFVVRNVEELEETLNEAFFIATSGRFGPVVIDIPRDVQEHYCEYERAKFSFLEKKRESYDMNYAISAIKNSKRPYIYAGGGVIASGAQDELLELSMRISAPVGLTMMGLTALDTDYELNLGMCGMHGRYASTVAQSECDLLICLGARFSDRGTGNVALFERGHTFLHIDIDISEIGKNITSHISICDDIKKVLRQLLSNLEYQQHDEWIDRIKRIEARDIIPKTDKFIPQNIIELTNEYFDENSIIATDVGQHQMWTMLYYKFRRTNTLLTSGGLGTMGYGLGAVIGGCIAKGNNKCLLITGDGSFGMNLNELATAVSCELPIIIVIINNGVLGMVRQWQTMFYEKRYSQTTLNRKTDFVAVAKAFGADGYKVNNLDELRVALDEISSKDRSYPIVIDCKIDMDENVYPMVPAGGSVKNIITRGSI